MRNIVGEWTTQDKTTWGAGPWQDEPDKVHWIDEATGMDCLIHRSPGSGAWCGYVAVPEGHPAFQRDYGEVDVRVHGGLTYADFCQHTDDESQGVCHVPAPGRPDRVWWLGFDCAHCLDQSPAMDARGPSLFGGFVTYRDRTYVESQVEALAQQLAQMGRTDHVE